MREIPEDLKNAVRKLIDDWAIEDGTIAAFERAVVAISEFVLADRQSNVVGSAPEGWVLIPVQWTEEMKNAYSGAAEMNDHPCEYYPNWTRLEAAYAAAPNPDTLSPPEP